MKSERVLVQINGADDWRGDDLRFKPRLGDALVRLNDLERSYRHISALRIVESEDEPTHAYTLDGTLRRLGDGRPPGYGESVDAPSMPVAPPSLYAELPTAESNLTAGGAVTIFAIGVSAMCAIIWFFS